MKSDGAREKLICRLSEQKATAIITVAYLNGEEKQMTVDKHLPMHAVFPGHHVMHGTTKLDPRQNLESIRTSTPTRLTLVREELPRSYARDFDEEHALKRMRGLQEFLKLRRSGRRWLGSVTAKQKVLHNKTLRNENLKKLKL